jgi:predicted esterase
MPRLLIAIASVLLWISAASAQTWQAQFDTLIQTPPGPVRERLIADIAADRPAWKEVVAKIASIPFPDTARGGAFLRQTQCIDGATRPYVIYVPSTYDPKSPAPMLIILHGSVSRPQIIPDPMKWAENTAYIQFSEKRGWFVLFPMGQAGATWWDEVGMTNVMTLLRTTKIDFNIDDDRVYLGGFSDGGSAGFLFAMTMPTDFAAFVALNGQMGVGSEDGGLPTYATNFYNSHIFATTTDRDQLYPTYQMERTIAMAKKAGAKIYYRRLEGEHDFNAIAGELPALFDYLEKHPRKSFPDTIVWETAVKGFGVCKWLAIDDITIDEPASWYVDYNVGLVDSSIAIGFQPADTFSGPGVMVAALADGDYLARRIGLRPGDVIIGGNEIAISNADDLVKLKATLRRGADVMLIVLRGVNELVLRGSMPAPKNYFLFNREQPSAVAKASFSNNRFDIQGSRVGAFRILINPEMIDLSKNVVVIFNGKKIFDDRVAPDIAFMLRDFLANRDRKLVFVNELNLRPVK